MRAKCPKMRTQSAPWGLDPTAAERQIPNLLLAVACCLLMVVARSGFGHATHEHPASAFSWHIPFWKRMVARGALEINVFCCCA